MALSPPRTALVLLALAVLLVGAVVPAVASPVPLGSLSPHGSARAGLPSPAAGVLPGRPASSPVSLGRALGRTDAPAATPAPASTVVASVQRAIATGQLKAREVLFPSADRRTGPPVAGAPVVPKYATSPAPMGLADLGISAKGAYVYNTTSFEANLFLTNFSAFSPGYAAFGEAPNWTTFVLDTVATNISFPGSTTGTFWAQNAVHFNGTELQFEDNVWNFSGVNGTLNKGTLLSYGGTLVPGDFYFDFGRTIDIRPQFDLRLFNNVSTYAGHPALYFNFSLENGTGVVAAGSYDRVVFNGTASIAQPPQFQVSGLALNPYGLLNDAEFVLGGDGGGSNANILRLNATETLDAWNATAGAYASVRSAYDFGTDTAETSIGDAEYYSGTTAYLNQGPSFLYGLWNTSNESFAPHAASGDTRVQVTVDPDYGFLFATNESSLGGTLAAANFSYAPTNGTGVLVTYLPPPPAGDPYVFEAWADGYVNGSVSIGAGAPPADLMLVASPTTLNAPVYLVGQSQAMAFATAGVSQTGYSSASKRLWLNASSPAPVAPFLRLNDFDYPTFVLLAVDEVNLSVTVNGLNQSASSFSYTTSALNGYVPVSIPGWTQGYYFFYGTGTFTVGNVTLEGNLSLFTESSPRYPPGAIEFVGTHDSQAYDVTAEEESYGIVAVGARSPTFSHVIAESAATGLTLTNCSTVVATDLSATGGASLGANMDGITTMTLTTVSATVEAYAVVAQNTSGLTIHGLTATAGASGLVGANLTSLNVTGTAVVASLAAITLMNLAGATFDGVSIGNSSYGLFLNNTTRVVIDDLSVAPDGSEAGQCTNTTHLTLDGLTVLNPEFLGSQLVLNDDRSVLVEDANTTGTSGLAVDLTNTTHANFSGVQASDGAIGLALNSDRFVDLAEVDAKNGSVGAALGTVANVTVTHLLAGGESIGLLWDGGSNGSLTGANVTNGAVGVYAANVTNLSVATFNGTESSLAPIDFTNTANGSIFPSAVVALVNDSEVSVTGVSSVEYPYGVLANNSSKVNVERVTSWYGNYSVAFNNTSGSLIENDFSFGGEGGIYLANVTTSTVNGSTLEDANDSGLLVLNGTDLTVRGNNFVGNNNSSTDGAFSAAHLQATVLANASSLYTFEGNYWADRSSGPYKIAPGVSDSTPLVAPVPFWLRYVEHGLPAGTAWGFSYLSTAYRTVQPLVYLPGWSLPTGGHGFVVSTVPGYTASPPSGTATFVPGSNATETIDFAGIYTVTFAESGLPTGTSWNVTLDGVVQTDRTTGPTASIVFNEGNGSFAYTVGEVAGWHLSGTSYAGSIEVAGADVTKTLVWTLYAYNVTFVETGLPGGTTWGITFNGTAKQTSSASLVLSELNGSYPFVVASVAGYTANVSTGTVTVSGAAVEVQITYSSSSSGTPITDYIVVGAVVGVVAVAAVVLLLRRRGRKPAREEVPPETGT